MRKILLPLSCLFFPHLCLAGITMDQVIQTRGLYGEYPVSREASGTSWQPETTPVPGATKDRDDLVFFYDGFINGGYIYDTSDRIPGKAFTTSMLTIRGWHPLEDSALGFRMRFSLDPLNGEEGYPLLLQGGGTSDGRNRLIDRQYAKDLISELALTFSYPVSGESWGFFYAAYPGSPALGAPDYTTRFSAVDNPVAPLTRRWFDGQMVSYGVITAGYASNYIKVDASVFNAKEPDSSRWNLEYEEVKVKSYSGRVAFKLSPMLVWDISAGHLFEPQRLAPREDLNRIVSFLSWNIVEEDITMQTSLGWGRNIECPGQRTDGYLLEASLKLGQRQTYFGRVERVELDDLFAPPDPRSSTVYTVTKVQLGYIYDFPFYGPSVWGIGGSVGAGFLPKTLETVYGERIAKEILVFLRVRL